MTINFHKKRIFFDAVIIISATAPSIIAFYCDLRLVTKDVFLRSGAIMALLAAFLEFRTHEIRAFRIKDSFNAMWRIIGVLTEGLARTDQAAKYVLREMSNVISAAGMEPAMGKAENIKDMVITEKIKSLKNIPDTSERYYRYNAVISILGKVLVLSGTIIWAFGDYFVRLFL